MEHLSLFLEVLHLLGSSASALIGGDHSACLWSLAIPGSDILEPWPSLEPPVNHIQEMHLSLFVSLSLSLSLSSPPSPNLIHLVVP